MNRLDKLEQVEKIVAAITYKEGWRVEFHADYSPAAFSLGYIQIECITSVDSQTGKPTSWVSGKRHISEWACSQEIVGSVFSLIKEAEMHEVHEMFRYKGACIYNPHLCPDALSDLAKRASSFVTRPDSMTKA